MTDLDALLDRARRARVRRAVVARAVRAIEHRASAVPHGRRWTPWIAAGLAAAAAAGLVVWWRRGGGEIAAPVGVGDRIAIIAEPGSAYRVIRSGGDDTAIAVDRGTVTARLWPGARPHHLVLSGGDVEAVAIGTVYSLTVRPGGAIVSVVEGTVEVHAVGRVHSVRAPHTWPVDSTSADPAPGRALLALRAPPRPAERAGASDAMTGVDQRLDDGIVEPELAPAPGPDAREPPGADAAPEPRDAGVTTADSADASGTEPREPAHHRANASGAANAADRRTASGSGGPATSRDPQEARAASSMSPTVKDRWQAARQERSQGHYRDAVDAYLAIADTRDTEWSPIALSTAVEIALDPLGDPARAIEIADRMLREWPTAALVPHVRDLRCRALRQLGKTCSGTARP